VKISPQLLPPLLRRRPQLFAGTAQGHGEARIEHVAQLGEGDALLKSRTAHSQLRQRHAGASARRAGLAVEGITRNGQYEIN
jgi:hypothetical protein